MNQRKTKNSKIRLKRMILENELYFRDPDKGFVI